MAVKTSSAMIYFKLLVPHKRKLRMLREGMDLARGSSEREGLESRQSCSQAIAFSLCSSTQLALILPYVTAAVCPAIPIIYFAIFFLLFCGRFSMTLKIWE